jgi:hypothetical protein
VHRPHVPTLRSRARPVDGFGPGARAPSVVVNATFGIGPGAGRTDLAGPNQGSPDFASNALQDSNQHRGGPISYILRCSLFIMSCARINGNLAFQPCSGAMARVLSGLIQALVLPAQALVFSGHCGDARFCCEASTFEVSMPHCAVRFLLTLSRRIGASANDGFWQILLKNSRVPLGRSITSVNVPD